jgi:hypothetical protein
MMGGAKVHYDGIVAVSQTDSTADLKNISAAQTKQQSPFCPNGGIYSKDRISR